MLYYFERMGPSYSPVGYMICYRGEMKNGKRNGQGTTFEKYNTENTYYEPGVYRDNHLTRSVGYAVYDDNNELIKMGNAVDPVYLDEEKQKEYLKKEEYMTIDLGNPTYSRDLSSRSKQWAAAAAPGSAGIAGMVGASGGSGVPGWGIPVVITGSVILLAVIVVVVLVAVKKHRRRAALYNNDYQSQSDSPEYGRLEDDPYLSLPFRIYSFSPKNNTAKPVFGSMIHIVRQNLVYFNERFYDPVSFSAFSCK